MMSFARRARRLAAAPLLTVALACGGTEEPDPEGEGGGETSGSGGASAGESGAEASSAGTTGSGSGGSGSSTTGGGESSTTGGSTGSTASTTTGSGTSGAEETGDEGTPFVVQPDSNVGNECDPKAQDCPEGQKCTAWANDGGNAWNANKCVDVSGEGQGGDNCAIQGSGVGGIDDCGVGFICLNTDDMGAGTCTQFCQGNDEDCSSGDVCAIYNDGVLPICLVGCHPLLQDCPATQECIDTPNGTFICFTDASGATGAPGDSCPDADGENLCDPGLWCGPSVDGCVTERCCTPFCDLSAPDCAAPHECVSYYGDMGSAPPGFEDVGVCVLP